jgi:hypothetical protein
MFGGLLSAKPAHAVRLVEFRIYLDGKNILITSFGDNGNTDKDGLWDHLKKLSLRTPDESDLRRNMTAAERAKLLADDVQREKELKLGHRVAPQTKAQPFVIKPDADDPLQATLKGKIKVEGRYSYTREVPSLRLVRKSETDNQWQIAPEEVDRMRSLKAKDLPQQ